MFFETIVRIASRLLEGPICLWQFQEIVIDFGRAEKLAILASPHTNNIGACEYSSAPYNLEGSIFSVCCILSHVERPTYRLF